MLYGLNSIKIKGKISHVIAILLSQIKYGVNKVFLTTLPNPKLILLILLIFGHD